VVLARVTPAVLPVVVGVGCPEVCFCFCWCFHALLPCVRHDRDRGAAIALDVAPLQRLAKSPAWTGNSAFLFKGASTASGVVSAAPAGGSPAPLSRSASSPAVSPCAPVAASPAGPAATASVPAHPAPVALSHSLASPLPVVAATTLPPSLSTPAVLSAPPLPPSPPPAPKERHGVRLQAPPTIFRKR
jgi:hypothetical protein